MSKLRRYDPIFRLPTPLLFAHRGGRREKPESTELAFQHALDTAKAEVLELDVQCTKKGQVVVWHGPDLSNVVLDEGQRAGKRSIRKYEWSELDGRAWVDDPEWKTYDPNEPPKHRLARVKKPERQLMLLEEFLSKFSETPLNIEVKHPFESKKNLRALVEILRRDPGDRPVVVVSGYPWISRMFEKLSKGRYPMGLSAIGVAAVRFGLGHPRLEDRAYQVPHTDPYTRKEIVCRVRQAGGAVHVFISGFKGIDPLDASPPTDDDLFPLLDRGIDGIMTDRPEDVHKIIERWKKAHPFPL